MKDSSDKYYVISNLYGPEDMCFSLEYALKSMNEQKRLFPDNNKKYEIVKKVTGQLDEVVWNEK